MDREWLATQLAAGRSFESIAAEVGKAPSTVSYWAQKHGLRSAHADRHAGRGGLTRADLEPLVDAGCTTREIAATLGVSQTTVRHWLRRHGLTTTRAARRKASSGVPRPKRILAECPKHGEAVHTARAEGGYRCIRCRSAAVSAWRRRLKERLIEEFGGRCAVCGYDRCPAVLHFHISIGQRSGSGLRAAGWPARSRPCGRRRASA